MQRSEPTLNEEHSHQGIRFNDSRAELHVEFIIVKIKRESMSDLDQECKNTSTPNSGLSDRLQPTSLPCRRLNIHNLPSRQEYSLFIPMISRFCKAHANHGD